MNGMDSFRPMSITPISTEPTRIFVRTAIRRRLESQMSLSLGRGAMVRLGPAAVCTASVTHSVARFLAWMTPPEQFPLHRIG